MRLSVELRDRSKRYASSAIRLYVSLEPRRREIEVIAHQLLRSGTSVAAHVREASRARSDAEFCSKLQGALEEADESQLWLELMRDDCGVSTTKLAELLHETNELIAIFVTMVDRTKRRAA